MNEPDQHVDHMSQVQHIKEHRFVLLIVGTIATALLLVIISMALYASSGTAQVDLSRPGYSSVRDQAKENDSIYDDFSGTGPIDSETLLKFETLYSARSQQITGAKAFNSDPLSDMSLRIEFE